MRAIVVVPDPNQPGLTPAERLALQVRVDALLAGRCACGARGTIHATEHGLAIAGFAHEPDCPAISPALERLAARLGERLAYLELRAELHVDEEPSS